MILCGRWLMPVNAALAMAAERAVVLMRAMVQAEEQVVLVRVMVQAEEQVPAVTDTTPPEPQQGMRQWTGPILF